MISNKFLFTVLVILLSEGKFAQNRNISCKFLEEALYLKLMCYFPEDIRVAKKDFSVYHYPKNEDGEKAVRLVNCYWIKDLDCEVKEGYEYNKIIHPDHISILITNVSSNHLGKYECQLHGDRGSCDLLTLPNRVEKNPSQETQAQGSSTTNQPVLRTGDLKSLQAADGISVGAGIGIGVGVGVGVPLIFAFIVAVGIYCWWKKKQTPENDNKNDNTNGETEPLEANGETTEDQNESQRTDNFVSPNLEQEEPRSEQRRKSLPQNDETNDPQKEAHIRTNSSEANLHRKTSSIIINLPEALPFLEGKNLHYEKTESERRNADGSTNISKMERLRITSSQGEGRSTSVKQESQPVSCPVPDTYQKESINGSEEEEEAEEEEEEEMTTDLHNREVNPKIRDPLLQERSYLTEARKLNRTKIEHQEDSFENECAPAMGNLKVCEKDCMETKTDC